MDRKVLESAATRVRYLRGLLAVPLGLLFILTGLGNLGWPPLAHAWVFLGVITPLVAAAYLINRYYDIHYGRVTPVPWRHARDTILSAVLFGAGMIGGSLLDFRVDLPISLFSVCFALAMLAWFALCVGLRRHHLVIWGALLIGGLLPVWGSFADRVSVAWLPIGVATIVAGVFDHRTLVRQYGPAQVSDSRPADA